jgi:hypothetical protein
MTCHDNARDVVFLASLHNERSGVSLSANGSGYSRGKAFRMFLELLVDLFFDKWATLPDGFGSDEVC